MGAGWALGAGGWERASCVLGDIKPRAMFCGADTTLEDVGGIEHEHPPPRARWPGALGSWLAGHYPWVLVWAGACHWHGVGGFVFVFNSSSSAPSTRSVCGGFL